LGLYLSSLSTLVSPHVEAHTVFNPKPQKMDSKQSEPFDIEDEEVFFEHSSNSPEDDEFDSIVSCLEEILQDDSFQSMLTKFYQDNCENFEEGKENKLEYTTTYNSYTTMVENALETFLSQKIPGFSMKRFESLVGSRKGSSGLNYCIW